MTCDIIYDYLIAYHFCTFFHTLGIGIFVNFQLRRPLKFLGILTILESQQEDLLLIDCKRSFFTVFVHPFPKCCWTSQRLRNRMCNLQEVPAIKPSQCCRASRYKPPRRAPLHLLCRPTAGQSSVEGHLQLRFSQGEALR